MHVIWQSCGTIRVLHAVKIWLSDLSSWPKNEEKNRLMTHYYCRLICVSSVGLIKKWIN